MDIVGGIFSDSNYAFKPQKKKKDVNQTKKDPLRLCVDTTVKRSKPLVELKRFDLDRFANCMLKPCPKIPSESTGHFEVIKAPRVDHERNRQRFEAFQRRQELKRMAAISQMDGILDFKLPCVEEETSVYPSESCQTNWKEMDIPSLHLDFSQFSWKEFEKLGF